MHHCIPAHLGGETACAKGGYYIPVCIAVLVLHIQDFGDYRHKIAQLDLFPQHLLLFPGKFIHGFNEADFLRLLVRLPDRDKFFRIRQRKRQIHSHSRIFLIPRFQGNEAAGGSGEFRVLPGEEPHFQKLLRFFFQGLLVKFLQIQQVLPLVFKFAHIEYFRPFCFFVFLFCLFIQPFLLPALSFFTFCGRKSFQPRHTWLRRISSPFLPGRGSPRSYHPSPLSIVFPALPAAHSIPLIASALVCSSLSL